MYNNPMRAIARLQGGAAAPRLTGTVALRQRADGVLVTARVTGLPASSAAGFFGFHIHEGGDCGGTDFAAAGGHYNPENTAHPMHAGDLPPLLGCGGTAYLSVLTNRFRLQDVLGRTVIIHAMPDDFRTQPAGDAGMRLACGVIRRA